MARPAVQPALPARQSRKKGKRPPPPADTWSSLLPNTNKTYTPLYSENIIPPGSGSTPTSRRVPGLGRFPFPLPPRCEVSATPSLYLSQPPRFGCGRPPRGHAPAPTPSPLGKIGRAQAARPASNGGGQRGQTADRARAPGQARPGPARRVEALSTIVHGQWRAPAVLEPAVPGPDERGGPSAKRGPAVPGRASSWVRAGESLASKFGWVDLGQGACLFSLIKGRRAPGSGCGAGPVVGSLPSYSLPAPGLDPELPRSSIPPAACRSAHLARPSVGALPFSIFPFIRD